MIWHFGHMEQFALICWFGWPCSAIIAMFVEWHPFPLRWAILTYARAQATNIVYFEITSTCTDHMNTGTHTHTNKHTHTHTQSYGRNMQMLKSLEKKWKEVHTSKRTSAALLLLHITQMHQLNSNFWQIFFRPKKKKHKFKVSWRRGIGIPRLNVSFYFFNNSEVPFPSEDTRGGGGCLNSCVS